MRTAASDFPTLKTNNKNNRTILLRVKNYNHCPVISLRIIKPKQYSWNCPCKLLLHFLAFIHCRECKYNILFADESKTVLFCNVLVFSIRPKFIRRRSAATLRRPGAEPFGAAVPSTFSQNRCSRPGNALRFGDVGRRMPL